MSDIRVIRTALARRLGTVQLPDSNTTLRSGELLRDTVNPPMALVGPDDPFIVPHLTMGDSTARVVNFKVYVFLSRTSERAAQDMLDGLLGSSAIEDAIESGWPETSVADFAEVVQVGNVGELVVGEVSYVGCEYSVMVVGS